MSEELLTGEEVEAALRVGKGWFYRNHASIPAVRLGKGKGVLRVRRSDLDRYLARLAGADAQAPLGEPLKNLRPAGRKRA